jgi:hypothetical protein
MACDFVGAPEGHHCGWDLEEPGSSEYARRSLGDLLCPELASIPAGFLLGKPHAYLSLGHAVPSLSLIGEETEAWTGLGSQLCLSGGWMWPGYSASGM